MIMQALDHRQDFGNAAIMEEAEETNPISIDDFEILDHFTLIGFD